MASIVREYSTDEYFHFWSLLKIETGVYAYAVYEFDGEVFLTKEKGATDETGYQNLGVRYDYVGPAPVLPICGPGFDPKSWEKYFASLKSKPPKGHGWPPGVVLP